MKLLSKHIEKNGRGKVTIVPENDDDLWVTYNLLTIGDKIRTSTFRKVQNESNTGSVNPKKIQIHLTIQIEAISTDSYGSEIAIKGRNVEENEFVKLGAYHTFNLSVNNKFTLWKDEWDSIALDLVTRCTDVTKNADLGAVIMQDGLAYICLITNSATVVMSKIETNIPQKRKGLASQHDKSLAKFIDQVTDGIDKHINFDVVRCLILASPGFLKDKLFENINRMILEKNHEIFKKNKSKFLLIHSSTGHKHSLKEVLMDPLVQARTADTKAAGETKSLENFFAMLKKDPSRAFYGFNHVINANDSGAIDTLLISDSLFRSRDYAVRRKYVDLVDSVKEKLGEVKIFSSCHISGEQLDNMAGIAAILRFPMLEPEDDESSSDDE